MFSYDDQNLVDKLKQAFESIMPRTSEEYPKEAVPPGTIVKSNTHGRSGIVTDAFYGDLDADKKKIIVYTILLFPKRQPSYASYKSESLLVVTEYEYDVIAYLMVPPIDLKKLSAFLGDPLI